GARFDVHQPDPHPSRLGVTERPEGQRSHVPALDRDHAAGLVVRQYPLQVLDGAVAEVAGVLDGKRDRGRAAELIADVPALDCYALPSLPEAVLDLFRPSRSSSSSASRT